MDQINLDMAKISSMAIIDNMAQIMARTSMANMLARTKEAKTTIIDNMLARPLDNSRLVRISPTPALYVVKKAIGEKTAPP